MTDVLLIEDDPGVRAVLERVLFRMALEVRVATDGRMGWAALDEGPYRLIITDLRMPHVGGLQILERAAVRCPGTPVVLVTGYADPQVEAAVEQAGAYLLGKPFRASTAQTAFETALAAGRRTD